MLHNVSLKQFGKGIYSANVFALILRFRFIIDISKFCGATDKDNDFLRNDKTVTISYELMYFVLSLTTDIFVSISSETVGILFKFTFSFNINASIFSLSYFNIVDDIPIFARV